MTHYWIAQSVGVLAFLVGITMFFNRNDQKFKIQLSAYSAVIGLHFFLMGANAAGASALLNSARTLISLKTHNILVMFVFISLTLLFGLSGMNHAMELLPIAGTVASTWALFRTSGLTTRCVMWCSTAGWVAHNIWLGSIGGSLIEGSFLLMNGFNIIRFWRMQQRGIDPFSVEKKA
ncbi:YgjV family protein [Pectobacterium brasiliense]|uniref:YgjV family protein n=1 Tax=Pectobacterium brasiliense TaxID=180957 RepID=UPI00057FD34D|nr:YgjV family protein [Pectobacterium brasiliense]KHS71842.1 membrane protein [Pectobacterium brasiliense]KHS80378.1 membrane protein [Pectobacterium brasiliense]KHS93997.1 membrane protein [Pectobacterium brasiliense]MBN3183338.1 YgjV family protein [Pectobacterium brasiliense]MDG0804817.1 YgjV family protein [Pectobacterium brasiliense]